MKFFKGYHTTPDGELYSLKTGLKKYTWHNQGRTSQYERVQFIVDGKPKNFYVHRIVAMLYCPEYCETLEVNHIDGDTLNNKATNLEMMNRSQNQIHYHELKVIKTIRNTRCIVKSGIKRVYSAGEIYA